MSETICGPSIGKFGCLFRKLRCWMAANAAALKDVFGTAC
jgi:hypothetical protein